MKWCGREIKWRDWKEEAWYHIRDSVRVIGWFAIIGTMMSLIVGLPFGLQWGSLLCFGQWLWLAVIGCLAGGLTMPFAVGWIEFRDKKTEARCRELEARLQELLGSEVSADEGRGERWTK